MMQQPGRMAPPALGNYQRHQYPPQQWMMMQLQHQPAHAQAPQFWQYQKPYRGAPANAVPVPGGADEVRSLWIGGLQYWLDEAYLTNCFSFTGESFRMNLALGARDAPRDNSPEHTIFVGNLAPDVTNYVLLDTFKKVYKSVKEAKVITDSTGYSKRYGFVKFADEKEQQRAMTEMNGVVCVTRQIRVGPTANKKPMPAAPTQSAFVTGDESLCERRRRNLQLTKDQEQQMWMPKPCLQIENPEEWMDESHQFLQQLRDLYQSRYGRQGESDPNNTTIFVGDLDTSVTHDYLKQVFSQFGELVHVEILVPSGNVVHSPGNKCFGKVVLSKCFGFVQFADRSCAKQALSTLNGTMLGGHKIRLSWTLGPSNAIIEICSVNFSLTDDYLKQVFSPFGELVRVNTHLFSNHGSCARQAFSTLNGTMLGGQNIRLSLDNFSSDAIISFSGLDPSVTEDDLKQIFSQYGELVDLQVDNNSGSVEFADSSCAEKDFSTSNGTILGGKNNCFSWRLVPPNDTIHVRHMDPSVTEYSLKQVFSQFGELVEVRRSKVVALGFVQFRDRSCAEQALSTLKNVIRRRGDLSSTSTQPSELADSLTMSLLPGPFWNVKCTETRVEFLILAELVE